MFRNILIALVLLLGALVLLDRARHAGGGATPSAAGATGAGAPAPQPGPSAGPRLPTVALGPAPAAFAPPPTATPALDLMTRLATRRRIVREGSNVYLDSLLAQTDSVVTRWFERTSLVVELAPDSTLPGWTPALLDEVRSAMNAWNGVGLAPAFREAGPGDSVDVTVHWVDRLSAPGQVGLTNLSWDADGIIHHATVNLALRQSSDSQAIPPDLRARVAVHELGHALGLPHSGDPDDVMFRSSPVVVPSARDQATLRLLYALFPGSIRAPQ